MELAQESADGRKPDGFKGDGAGVKDSGAPVPVSEIAVSTAGASNPYKTPVQPNELDPGEKGDALEAPAGAGESVGWTGATLVVEKDSGGAPIAFGYGDSRWRKDPDSRPDESGMTRWLVTGPAAGNLAGQQMRVESTADGGLKLLHPHDDIEDIPAHEDTIPPEGVQTRRFQNGVVVTGDILAGRAVEIVYKNGDRRSFSYDGENRVSARVDPDGTTWFRVGEPNDRGESFWKSKTGKTEILHNVSADSLAFVSFTDSSGMTHIIDPGNRESLFQPAVRSGDVERLFQKNIGRLDADADGFVTEEDIDRAFNNHAIRGEDAQFLAMMKDCWKDLASFKLEGSLLDAEGVSLEAVKEFHRQAQEHKARVDAASAILVKLNPPRLDQSAGAAAGDAADSDGDAASSQTAPPVRLTPADIETLSRHLSAREDADLIEKARAGQLDPVDLYAYLIRLAQSDIGKTVASVDHMLYLAMGNLQPTMEPSRYQLYGDKNDPVKSVVPQAVIQGRTGDCYMLAPLSSYAKINPGAVLDMIKDNKDGSFTVTFPGRPDNPITVDAPTQAQLARFAGTSRHGFWPAVIEKAYARLRQSDRGQNSVLPEALIDGGSPREAGYLLTGKPGMTLSLEHRSESRIEEIILDAIGRKDLLMAVTPKINNPFARSERNHQIVDGLVGNHAFSILDYDADKKLVMIRNPWGRQEPEDASGRPLDGTDDGVFKMPLGEFKRKFLYIDTVGTS